MSKRVAVWAVVDDEGKIQHDTWNPNPQIILAIFFYRSDAEEGMARIMVKNSEGIDRDRKHLQIIPLVGEVPPPPTRGLA